LRSETFKLEARIGVSAAEGLSVPFEAETFSKH